MPLAPWPVAFAPDPVAGRPRVPRIAARGAVGCAPLRTLAVPIVALALGLSGCASAGGRTAATAAPADVAPPAAPPAPPAAEDAVAIEPGVIASSDGTQFVDMAGEAAEPGMPTMVTGAPPREPLPSLMDGVGMGGPPAM